MAGALGPGLSQAISQLSGPEATRAARGEEMLPEALVGVRRTPCPSGLPSGFVISVPDTRQAPDGHSAQENHLRGPSADTATVARPPSSGGRGYFTDQTHG